MRTYDRSNTRQHLSSTNGLLDKYFTFRIIYTYIYLFACHFADDDTYNNDIICIQFNVEVIISYSK